MSPPTRKQENESAATFVMVDQAFVDEIRTSLRELQSAIRGDELGNRGLVNRVLSLEENDKQIHLKLALWGGVITGAVFVIQWLKSLFK